MVFEGLFVQSSLVRENDLGQEGLAEDEDVTVAASCGEIHFNREKRKLQEIEETAMRGLAPFAAGVPRETSWTRGDSCLWSRGQQTTDLGPNPLPASFYT